MRALSISSLTLVVALAGCAFQPTGHGDGGADDDTDRDGAAVDGADPVDARDVDARDVDARPSFDASVCPGDYRGIGDQPTRYRMIDGGTWAAAEVACKLHAPGLTHLAVFSDDGERDAVGTVLFFSGEFRRTWIGVLNDGNGARTVTGEPRYPSTGVEPGQAVSWIRDLITPFRAEPMTTSYAALCECDGLPASP